LRSKPRRPVELGKRRFQLLLVLQLPSTGIGAAGLLEIIFGRNAVDGSGRAAAAGDFRGVGGRIVSRKCRDKWQGYQKTCCENGPRVPHRFNFNLPPALRE
jgi:hypothetical protein